MKTFKFFKKQQGNFLNGVNLDIVAIETMKYLRRLDCKHDEYPVEMRMVGVDIPLSIYVYWFVIDHDTKSVDVAYYILDINENIKKAYSFAISFDEFAELYEDR
jgi:hypothetical protein